MYGCESWTVKKAEHCKIDAFELWCWRRLLRVPWTARRSNQSILREISPGCSLEGLMLKLKLQFFGHLMLRADSLKKTPMLGKIESGRKRGWQWMRWGDGITDQWTWVWVDSGSWWWTGRPGVLRFMGSRRVGHDWVDDLNWKTLCTPHDFPSLFHCVSPKTTILLCNHGTNTTFRKLIQKVKLISQISFLMVLKKFRCNGLLWWACGKDSASHCRGHRFNPCSGKISHAVEWLKPLYHSYWALAL